jgi:chromosome segregation ATPase
MSEQHTITSLGVTSMGFEPGDKISISGTAAQEAEENSAKLVVLLETRLRRRGAGTDDDMLRNVREYWSVDGKKIAEYDVSYPNPVETIEGLKRSLDYEKTRCAEARAEQETLQAMVDSLNQEREKLEGDVRKLKNKILEVTRPARSKKHRARKKAAAKKTPKKTK